MASMRPNLAIIWPLFATIGCTAFTAAAVHLFPYLTFAEASNHPYTQDTGRVEIIFAVLVGLGWALGQALAFLWTQSLASWRLALWVALSALASTAMVVPLWWAGPGAWFFFWVPGLLIGPGLLAMAVMQGLLLHPRINWLQWSTGTLLGGIVGWIVSLPVASMLWPIRSIIPFEAIWSGTFALTIALFQCRLLKSLR